MVGLRAFTRASRAFLARRRGLYVDTLYDTQVVTHAGSAAVRSHFATIATEVDVGCTLPNLRSCGPAHAGQPNDRRSGPCVL